MELPAGYQKAWKTTLLVELSINGVAYINPSQLTSMPGDPWYIVIQAVFALGCVDARRMPTNSVEIVRLCSILKFVVRSGIGLVSNVVPALCLTVIDLTCTLKFRNLIVNDFRVTQI